MQRDTYCHRKLNMNEKHLPCGPLEKLTLDEFFKRFHWESMRKDVLKTARQNNATHVVMAENKAFDSSSFGARTCMIVGPSCTYKTPEDCEGKWLNDLPSRRQYFTTYAAV